MTAVSDGCSSFGHMGVRQRQARPRPITYVRDIPVANRQQICRLLDSSHAWINLAGLLEFTNDDVQSFKLALQRDIGGPTDQMLTVWDYSCHTVTELYQKLFKMKHARCMMLLKDYVDPSLHHLIQEIQGIQPADDNESSSGANVHPGHPQIPPVTYVPGAGGQSPHPVKMPAGMMTSVQDLPGQPQATQGSWNGAEQGSSSAADCHSPHRPKSERSEGLTANIDKNSSEKIIGLGSPFKDWQGERESYTSVNNKSGNSGGSSGITSAQNQEMGEKEKLEHYQNQSALSLLMHIHHEDIVKATDNFSSTHKLGEGYFGSVYHAVIKLTHYAVKRMKQNENMGFETNKIARADQMKELRALTTYRNPNIVALCAYCMDGPSPCLVYEYMENGSLEDNLLCKAQRQPLNWRTRHKIAEGAALGINYLHKAQEQPLIHGDIKSANILLGKHMEPKIADFGLARLGPENGKTYCYLQTKIAHGTRPYLPEEFKRSFKLSTKVDVYSYGVVLMEILAGERVSDSRREPNRLLTDIVEEACEIQQPEGVIEKIRDRRCPDWPWDIAWHLLALARECTLAKFTKRPEIDKAVNTLRDIAAQISIRDEMQKHREDFPVQNPQWRSPEYFQDPYPSQPPRYSLSGQEMSVRYPPTSMGSVGQDWGPVRRDWSIESNSAVTGPGLMDPRCEPSTQRQQMQQRAQPYDPRQYPFPQGYTGPRPGGEPGSRQHTLSETSEENNLVVDDKMLDSYPTSSLTSYDMSSVMPDPSMCRPLLFQSQLSGPSSVSYPHQQSHPYYPPVFDQRQSYPSQQYPMGNRGQTPQQYPQQIPAQYQNPLHSSIGGNVYPQADMRYQSPDANFYAAQTPTVSSTSRSGKPYQESSTLQEHMKQLDISQLPTKPLGGSLRPETSREPQTSKPSQQEAPKKEPEQNTDILSGYKPTLKEKSFRSPLVPAISEESENEASPLQTSLTTAEMKHFLSSKPREPTQQTEELQGTATEALTKAARANPNRSVTAASSSGVGTDKTTNDVSDHRSSLTTEQMRKFIPGNREPSEETEEATASERLTSASRQPDSTPSQPTPTLATEANDKTQCVSLFGKHHGTETDSMSSLTTAQMRQFLPTPRQPSQESEAIPGEDQAASSLAKQEESISVQTKVIPETKKAPEESE